MYVNLLFWFQFFCGFSGSTMSNSWVLIFFNLLFTSTPPLLYGVMDKNMPAGKLLSRPHLYKAGQNSQVGNPSGTCSYSDWSIIWSFLTPFFSQCVCALCSVTIPSYTQHISVVIGGDIHFNIAFSSLHRPTFPPLFGWPCLMRFTKAWSASSFPTLWVLNVEVWCNEK